MEIRWQRIFKLHTLARNGMSERKAVRMEELSVEAEILLLLPAIHRISHARMLDVFHMHANLMRAARKELAIDECETVVVFCRVRSDA